MKIGIFYGSSTGNTKKISYLIYTKLVKYVYCKIFNISEINLSEFNKFDILILGTSTWYYGRLQFDWYNFLNYNKNIILKKKIICFFGCGNKLNYSYTFCDGLYYLYKSYNKNNTIIGYWNNIYKFKNSKSLLCKNYFLGLVIDDNNSYKINNKIINIWLSNFLVYLFKI